MTRPLLLGLLLAPLLLGCGKYGPPSRVGERAGAGPAHSSASCQDPAHAHEEPLGEELDEDVMEQTAP